METKRQQCHRLRFREVIRHPEVAAKRPSKDAAEAFGLSAFEAR